MKNTIWLPFTQLTSMTPPLKVASGKGVMLTLEDGRQIMDCISSWWVTLHGHGQPEIGEAIARQAALLEQVIAAGFIHQPVIDLTERLATKLPEDLHYFFFSDDGSTAVEVGLKMAYQYWRNKGVAGRNKFLSFEEAYHGDTVGAMSLGGPSIFNRTFADLLFDCDFVPFPATHLHDTEVEGKEEACLAHLKKLLEAGPEIYAALFIEPLIQGAGGMRMCRPEFLRQVLDLVRQYEVLVVYDEVMTGFGRTGEWFASIKSQTTPDIICLSKGITGGFLPLAATVCSDQVYEAFYDRNPEKTFFHGHSYTANPLGCAAGVASFDLLVEKEVIFQGFEARHRRHLELLAGHPKLTNHRCCGTIGAVEFVCKKEGYLSEVGPKLKSRFLEQGFLLRPLGNVIYILPPYCISDEELAAVYTCISRVTEELGE